MRSMGGLTGGVTGGLEKTNSLIIMYLSKNRGGLGKTTYFMFYRKMLTLFNASFRWLGSRYSGSVDFS